MTSDTATYHAVQAVAPGQLELATRPLHAFEAPVAAGSADQVFPGSQFRGGLPPHVLRRVREHIQTHLGSTLTLRDLATTAGLSASHFGRAFKQSEGMTPRKYLLKCRLRQAVQLLAGTELPLSEIAFASGFCAQSHFSRQFRKYVGITPSRYRWLTR